MILNYYLIQYVEDPFKNEGKNIGVLAYNDDNAYFKALGVDADGAVDSGDFECLSAYARSNAWVYREWGNWFRELTRIERRRVDGQPFDALELVLEDLEHNGHNIVTRRGGCVEVSKDEDPSKVINEIFEALVSKPAKPKMSVFDAGLRKTMEQSEVISRPDYEEDVEVAFDAFNDKPPVTVRFPFLLANKPRTVFKIVRFKTNSASFMREVNDALFTFEKSIERGFALKDRCIIFTEPAPRDKTIYRDQLARFAHVVDVTSSQAAAVVRSIVATGKSS